MKEKAFPYLLLALLAFAVLGLEIIILLVGSLFYGTTNLFRHESVVPTLVHWSVTCAVWGIGIWLLYLWAKRKGFNAFENKSKAPAINWVAVGVLFIVSVVSSYISWDMRFKPMVEFNAMTDSFGNYGTIAFIGQYIYYVVEGVLFLAIIVFGQKFGELAFKKEIIPWGGILCGITWGLVHILTQGSLFVGLYVAVLALIFGVVYLLLKKNVRYTYPVITLMFML